MTWLLLLHFLHSSSSVAAFPNKAVFQSLVSLSGAIMSASDTAPPPAVGDPGGDGALLHALDAAAEKPSLEEFIAGAAPLVLDRLIEERQKELSNRNLPSHDHHHHKHHHEQEPRLPPPPPTPPRALTPPRIPQDSLPKLPHRPPSVTSAPLASTTSEETLAPPIKPPRPLSQNAPATTDPLEEARERAPSIHAGLQNVEIVEEDTTPPPLPFRSEAEEAKRQRYSAGAIYHKQKEALKHLKLTVNETVREQVKSTKDYIKLFTEPYAPPPSKFEGKSLSIGSVREAGARFQDAITPYVDCIEAVVRVAHWENPWRTGLLMVFYFWAWYATYLPFFVLFSPIFGLAATYAHSKNMFPGHGTVTRVTPENAMTPLGAATGFASAASDSISAAAKAPASASKWWRAMGDLYGTGREGLVLLDEVSVYLEKVKNLVLWKVPRKTVVAALVYIGSLIGLYLTPRTLIYNGAQIGAGLYFFVIIGLKHHFPAYAAYKAQSDSVALFFEGVPSDADLEREEREARVRAEEEKLKAEMNSEATPEQKSKSLEKIYETACIFTKTKSILDSAYGQMYLTPSHLVFFSEFNADKGDLEVAWTNITDVRRVRVRSWVVGDGRGVRIASSVDGVEHEYIFTNFPNRNDAFNHILVMLQSLGLILADSPRAQADDDVEDDNESVAVNDDRKHLSPDDNNSDARSVTSGTSANSSDHDLYDEDDYDNDDDYSTTAEPASAPPRIIVSDPETKTSAIGLPSYTTYRVSVPALNTSVRRRYKEFLKLREVLGARGTLDVPRKSSTSSMSGPKITVTGDGDGGGGSGEKEIAAGLELPPKTVFGRFSKETVEKRRRALERFVNALAERGEVWGSDPWKKFLFG
ncbi:hypothetical protein BDZ88DRAFT_421417, partial [Geranomyces variabilis]